MEKREAIAALPKTHVQCRQCGEDMPCKADRCPHCGRVTERKLVRQILLALGALILAIMLGVGYFMK